MAFTHVNSYAVGSGDSYITVDITGVQVGDVMVGLVLALDSAPAPHPPDFKPTAWWQTGENVRTTYDAGAAGYRVATADDVSSGEASWYKSNDQAGYVVMSIFRPSSGYHARVVQGGSVGRSTSGGSETVGAPGDVTVGNLLVGCIAGWTNDNITAVGDWVEGASRESSVGTYIGYKTADGVSDDMETTGWTDGYNYRTMFEIEEVPDFPVVQARNADTGGAEGTSHTIDLPAGVTAGDMLLAKAHAGNASGGGTIEPITSWGAGWNEIGHDFAWKKATGAETTFSFSTASNAYGSGFSWIIDPDTTTDWTVERPPEATSSSWDGTNRSPNPPPHNASWGTAKTLWVASGAICDTFTTPTYPPGWDETQTLGDSSYPSHSVAESEFFGAAINPWAFGWDGFATAGNESTVAISPLEVVGGGDTLPEGNLMTHDGTSWVDVKSISVNTGSWTDAKKIWVHDGSDWAAAWENEVTETFPYEESLTYSGTGTDAAGFRAMTPIDADENEYYLGLGTTYYFSTPEEYFQRALWTPGKGSASGVPMHDALLDRTVTDFRVSIEVTTSYHARNLFDGYPTNIPFWGSNYATPPTTLNPSELVFLGVISLYPDTYSYEQGWATLTAAQLGSPTYRTPIAYKDVSLFSQLDSNAKTKLTNGFIKSIVIQAYYYDNTDTLQTSITDNDFIMMGMAPNKRWNWNWNTWYNLNEPNYYGWNFNVLTGDPDAFRIKVTHKG